MFVFWLATGCTSTPPSSCDLLIIAHRGASGDRPEHTLAAYELAIQQGADFIEPDLVATADGVLVARHENTLARVKLDHAGDIALLEGSPQVIEATTNIAELRQFDDRLRVKEIRGRRIAGWFIEDFTWAELEPVRARERMPGLRPESAAFDDAFRLARIEPILELAARHGVGVYPEIKHPGYFLQNQNIDLAQLLMRALTQGPELAREQVILQSFEPDSLRHLRQLQSKLQTDWSLVQLIGFRDLDRYIGQLDEVARYADGIGPAIPDVLGSDVVALAKAQDLIVHAYTLRQEAPFLPEGVLFEEVLMALHDQGVDGVFTDHPYRARTACASRSSR